MKLFLHSHLSNKHVYHFLFCFLVDKVLVHYLFWTHKEGNFILVFWFLKLDAIIMVSEDSSVVG